MKLSRFLDGMNLGLKAGHGLFRKVKEAVKPAKGVHLSHLTLVSTAAVVRFGAQAAVASFKRNRRHEVLSAVRRNTRGLPPGFSRHQRMRKVDALAVPEVLRFDPLKKEFVRAPHDHAEQALALSEACKVGAELRRQKPAKIARRVPGGKRVRSCSVMRSVVDILERREFQSSGASRLVRVIG